MGCGTDDAAVVGPFMCPPNYPLSTATQNLEKHTRDCPSILANCEARWQPCNGGHHCCVRSTLSQAKLVLIQQRIYAG